MSDARSVNEDLETLADAFFDELCLLDGASPGLDCKRPFGNSDVEGDILELLDIEPGDGGYTDEERDYALTLFRFRLIPYLKRVWNERKP